MSSRGFKHGIALFGLLMGSAMLSAPAAAQGASEYWEGWYAGGTVGVTWTDVDIAIPPNKFSNTYSGVSGGPVIGNNVYVTDRHLVGFEADITFADLMGGITMARHKVSLLARVGRFYSPTMLLFAVGGLAGGQYKAKVTTTATTTQIVFDDDNEQIITITNTTTTNTKRNKRLLGYTVGAGFEREATLRGRPIRWGMEYRFTDFREWKFTAAGQAFKIDPEVHELRLRLVVPFQRAPAAN